MIRELEGKAIEIDGLTKLNNQLIGENEILKKENVILQKNITNTSDVKEGIAAALTRYIFPHFKEITKAIDGVSDKLDEHSKANKNNATGAIAKEDLTEILELKKELEEISDELDDFNEIKGSIENISDDMNTAVGLLDNMEWQNKKLDYLSDMHKMLGILTKGQHIPDMMLMEELQKRGYIVSKQSEAKKETPIEKTEPTIKKERRKRIHYKTVRKGVERLDNEITREVLKKYKPTQFFSDTIRDFSIAINTSYETVMNFEQVKNFFGPIFDKYKLNAGVNIRGYMMYFIISGQLSKAEEVNGTTLYKVMKDHTIPTPKTKDRGIFDELEANKNEGTMS